MNFSYFGENKEITTYNYNHEVVLAYGSISSPSS